MDRVLVGNKGEDVLGNPLIFLTSVLALGMLAQWLAWRLRMPSILLLLILGFAAGYLSDYGPDEFFDESTLFSIVSLSVAVILFEGGLSLQLHELRESGRVVLRLVTLGVLVSWLLTGTAGWWFLGMDPRIAALTGAILVVTGPTVIGPLLRHVRPARPVGAIIKWEGIVIDPIGAVLAVLVFEAVIAGGMGSSTHVAGPMLVKVKLIGWIVAKTVILGGAIAWITSRVLVDMLLRFLIPDFLHNALILTVAVAVFAVSNMLQPESGLVSVTLLGILLANQKRVPVRHVIEFKENLRVLLISCLFIVLSWRVELDAVYRLGMGGILFLISLIGVIRPASVFLATWGTGLNWRERTFLAFLAPRGIVAAAVSAVFALEVSSMTSGGAAANGTEKIVPLTFLVIVGTVSLYGLLAAPLARRLRLSVPDPQGVLFAGASAWVRAIAAALQAEGYQVLLIDTSYQNISAARMEGLPVQCASILSEYVEEEIDLGSIGRLLAVTPNDDLNALAVMEFAQVFGRAEVYQLTPTEATAGRRESTSPHIGGRYVFGPSANFDALALRLAQNSQIKRTKITEEFTYEQFRELYGPSAFVLFVKDEFGKLTVCSADAPSEPKPGQTVIALVDPVDPP